MSSPTIVWFRQDLRLQDNPALKAAVVRGGPVVPVFVLDDAAEKRWVAGAASRWWLHHSLTALDESLSRLGSRLVVARGDSASVLRTLIDSTGATALFWNRRYEPASHARDTRLRTEFESSGVEVSAFNGALLREPEAVANKQGRPFQVFTAYWRHCLTLPVDNPARLNASRIEAPPKWPRSLPMDDLDLRPTLGWAAGFEPAWAPGEIGASRKLRRFVPGRLEQYATERDRPDHDGTSMLSPHLHFGEISPRQVWAAVRAAGREAGVFPPSRGAGAFLGELGWREFAYHLLFHFPASPERPIRREFEQFSWMRDPRARKLRAWERGLTGYPIVDAGMRQLWRIGWMHNRVRMIVASFLVKHLRLPWVQGAAWFWDTLVDADLANNTLGWQWSAGCGVDAAPYFRIFSPMLQGRKFDPAGDYVRRWVPELAKMPAGWIHEPWHAPPDVLQAAGVQLGSNYPSPLVDHATARADALAAFQQLRKSSRHP